MKQSSSNMSIVFISLIFLLSLQPTESTNSTQLTESSTTTKQNKSCICAQEMLNFTIRRKFCGAELLSEACNKNAIYK